MKKLLIIMTLLLFTIFIKSIIDEIYISTYPERNCAAIQSYGYGLVICGFTY